ncbi:hypothetical protein GWI33_012391 [Rhynchophorus ferrugineus]|uniref:Uncharacterized protein n=1 Tax=Rhynchophorus ferrugineus TaxID=354439 RepID=A0A834IIY8_RHYFE|nr:hypothetical protein GWI33_012391 [Rhynchophorus ferrugineus]
MFSKLLISVAILLIICDLVYGKPFDRDFPSSDEANDSNSNESSAESNSQESSEHFSHIFNANGRIKRRAPFGGRKFIGMVFG